jgi:hypothetical protein
MLEVAGIVRLHGEAFRKKWAHRLTPVQQQALADIEHCRTAFFGGHVHQCGDCGREVYAYHSCRNRSCPKCHQDQTDRWIARQRSRLPACDYYLLAFTLPKELHTVARNNPKKLYGLLMKAAADALQKLARDPRYLGARLGILAVLHTWTRAMLYHPHVHLLVTAGGPSDDGARWIQPKNPDFLVPVRALSIIFRAKLCAALKRANLLQPVPVAVWKKPWVVHSQHAGSGHKVLEYLGRYIFRIAITNSRIESIQDGNVVFRYRDNQTQLIERVTISGLEFLERFLQHVLPRGCAKVRHYGIFAPACRPRLQRVAALLSTPFPLNSQPSSLPASPAPPRCPFCKNGNLVSIRVLTPHRSRSP